MKFEILSLSDRWFWMLTDENNCSRAGCIKRYTRKSDAIRGALRFASQVAESAIALDDRFEYIKMERYYA